MPGLPRHLGNLLNPRAYPHAVSAVELVETATSWVFLAGEYAYKIGRSAGSLAERKRRCDDEVRLGHRYAPGLYGGTVQIAGIGDHTGVDVAGSVLDFAVRLCGYDPRQELARLLQARAIEPHELAIFGRDLAVIHEQSPAASLGRALLRDGANIHARFSRTLERAARCATSPEWHARIQDLRVAMNRRLATAATWVETRRQAGRVRECHGELLAENVVRVAARFAAFNCREEPGAERWTDVAEEVASLTEDIASRGRPLHAQEFRNGYLAESRDFGLCRLLRLHEAHRCLLRANRMASHLPAVQDRSELQADYGRLLRAALTTLAPPPLQLILMCGPPGSGKTWLARLLATQLGAVHMDQSASGPAAAQWLDLVYGVDHVLGGGYTAIVDVPLAQRSQRATLLRSAEHSTARPIIIDCRARPRVLRPGATESSTYEGVRADEPAQIIHVNAFDPRAPDTVARRILG